MKIQKLVPVNVRREMVVLTKKMMSTQTKVRLMFQFECSLPIIRSKIFRFGFNLFICLATYLFSNF